MASQLPVILLQTHVLRLALSCIFNQLVDHSIMNQSLNAKNPDP